MKERVPIDEILTTTKQVLYIPHHGGYHKKILGKKRVVFDCIALCHCQSLNHNYSRAQSIDLLSIGPEILNVPWVFVGA